MKFQDFLNTLPVRRADSVQRWLRKNPFKIKSTESSSSSLSEKSIIIDSPEELPEGVTCWEDLYKRKLTKNYSDDHIFQCRLNQRVRLKRLYEIDWQFYNSKNCQPLVFTKLCSRHHKENKSIEIRKTRKTCPLCEGSTFSILLRLTVPLKTSDGNEILVALKSSKFPEFETQCIFREEKLLEMMEFDNKSPRVPPTDVYKSWLESVKTFVRKTLTSKKLKILTGKVIRLKNDNIKKRVFLFSDDFEIIQ